MRVGSLDEDCARLLSPVRDVLDAALARIPSARTVDVSMGTTTGFWDLRQGTVVLSRAFATDALHHPDEMADVLPPLDRWRRAAACVLEGASTLELAHRLNRKPANDWRWMGAAIYAAHQLAPDLGTAIVDLITALRTGCPGQHPRAGYAVMRAYKALGHKPMEQMRYLLCGGVVSAQEWAKLGDWLFSSDGGRAEGGVPIEACLRDHIAGTLPPWSWTPAILPAGTKGGRIQVTGDGCARPVWLVSDGAGKTLLSSASEACTFELDSGAPVGRWRVASAEAFGHIVGARGVEFCFARDGRLDVVLADAFVGPLAAIALAGEQGTSGACVGRWTVAGKRRLRLDGIRPDNMTVHGRGANTFMLPSKGFGLAEWLGSLDEDVWRWETSTDARLVLKGRLKGGSVEVRFHRVTSG